MTILMEKSPDHQPTAGQTLADHGDLLYRMALLLTEDVAQTRRMLRITLSRVVRTATPTSEVEPAAWMGQLLTTIRQETERTDPLARLRRLRLHYPQQQEISDDPLYQAIRELPRLQRQMLGLHLLAGYDLPLMTRVSGVDEIDEAAAQTLLQTALTTLAPYAGVELPDSDRTDRCPATRSSLMRADGSKGSDTTTREHLALCSACRAFERAWSNLTRQVEQSLRGTLRHQTLPPAFYALVQPKTTLSDWLRTPMLVPLLVLLFIGGIVLPGFFRQPTQPETAEVLAAVPPRDLVRQALDQVGQPPAGTGVWHAQWELLWYFSDGSFAPLQADAWLDTENPARHRIQFAHADSGAPYELQIGDGRQALWYALHPTYYGSLYSSLATVSAPQLIHRTMEPEAQEQVRTARFQTGVWDLGPNYLRQAAAAPDLRTLGQQRSGDRVVQIVSFVGVSPLELPPDAPGATTRQVTVLLTLDQEDGRLRKVTELLGPANGVQTSRVTWQLRSEEWIVADQPIRPVFDPDHAWTGKRNFNAEPQGTSADPDLLLIEQEEVYHPALLNNNIAWLPTSGSEDAPVPGARRALLYRIKNNTLQITYLGTGRQLTLPVEGGVSFTAGQPDEQIEVGPWTVDLYAGKGQRYRLKLQRSLSEAQTNSAAAFWSGIVEQEIYADGYTRAELLQVVRSLQPFNTQSLLDQEHLFVRPANLKPEVDAALLNALRAAFVDEETAVRYWREQHYLRQNPEADPLADPYHSPRYEGRTETMIRENWVSFSDETPRYFQRSRQADGTLHSSRYVDSQQIWYYWHEADLVESFEHRQEIPHDRINTFDRGIETIFTMLTDPGEQTVLLEQPDGTRVISRTEPIKENNFTQSYQSLPYLGDIEPFPLQRTTTLHLSADDGKPVEMRTSVVPSNPENTIMPGLIEQWQLLETADLSLEEVPPELRRGEPPPASVHFMRDPNTHRQIRQVTLSQERDSAETPLFRLPDDAPLQLYATNDEVTQPESNAGTVALDSLPRMLVQIHAYREPNDRDTRLLLFQGPAQPLHAFLQVFNNPWWDRSEPRRVVIAGREVDAWLMQRNQGRTARYWLFAEIDGTLLIAEGKDSWFLDTAMPLLATLEMKEST
ncbi:MAG: hypothetical protein ACLFVO_09675 [Chloroflexaceae bacterium]